MLIIMIFPRLPFIHQYKVLFFRLSYKRLMNRSRIEDIKPLHDKFQQH